MKKMIRVVAKLEFLGRILAPVGPIGAVLVEDGLVGRWRKFLGGREDHSFS